MSETIQFYAYSPTTTIIIKPCNYMKICSLDLQQSETTGQIRGQTYHKIDSTNCTWNETVDLIWEQHRGYKRVGLAQYY